MENFAKNFCSKFATKLIICLGIISSLFLTACSDHKNSAEYQAKLKESRFVPENYSKPTPITVIKVAYEAPKGSALDLSMIHWKDMIEDQSFGTIRFDLYPHGSLGSDSEVIERIKNGEAIITIADNEIMYKNGQNDVNVFSIPYMINNWTEARNLANSPWYQSEIQHLQKTSNIHVLSSNWHMGSQHILSTVPIDTVEDLTKLNIRVADDTLNFASLKNMGCNSVYIENANEITSAFLSSDINAISDSISNILDYKYYEQAKYLFVSYHNYRNSNMIMNENVWRSLDQAQKMALKKTSIRTSEFYNIAQLAAEHASLEKLIENNVQIIKPSSQYFKEMYLKSQNLYAQNVDTNELSNTLQQTLAEVKQLPQNKNIAAIRTTK